jgi:hypothetical protein
MRYELPDFGWAIIRSWRQAGVWDRIMDVLAAGHDPTVQMIDTSIVRGADWARLSADFGCNSLRGRGAEIPIAQPEMIRHRRKLMVHHSRSINGPAAALCSAPE